MRILIVKLGAIGDIVHSLPALAVIRQNAPDANISWIVERSAAEILRDNLLIDDLIEVDTRSLRNLRSVDKMLVEARSQLKGLRKHQVDVSIDLQGLLKSAVISKLSGAKKRWGFSRTELREPASRVFYTDTASLPDTAHVIQRSIGLVQKALSIKTDDLAIEFPIFTSDSHVQEADDLTRNVPGRFAILNPAGGWVTKLWHAEKYGQLADLLWERYGIASIVATGPNEGRLARKVMANSHSGKTIIVEPSLKGFFELAKRATVYVGGDTGPTHLAVAAGTPVVGIFGPTEWWRNGSPNPDDICVERVDIDCRIDCNRRKCSNWICMDITAETVCEAVHHRLSRLGNETDTPVVGK